MELYSLYYAIFSAITFTGAVTNKGVEMPNAMYGALAVGGVIWAVLFVLQGIALYAMGKKQGVKGSWRAFVPFANLYFMGKVAGVCTVFGQKVKRAGLYALIAQIALVALCTTEIVGQAYLWTTEGMPAFDQFNRPYWGDAQGAAASLNTYLYSYNEFIRSIIQMVYEIMIFIVLMGIYKKYVPNTHFVFSILSLFIPLSRCIILFVIRNRDTVDYDEFMRQKREEFIRSRTGGYTAYGTPMQATPSKPEEPFAEFDEEKKNESDSDEFFS
ncbi:MAG: hypothetical protein IJ996_02080 [Clostridia bacterium]|nr:hypothetical protein [Clostridia bacterium]